MRSRRSMDESWRSRITLRPDQMGGVPCIRELRIPVETIMGMIINGMTFKEILKAYPCLEEDDLQATLKYAAAIVRGDFDGGAAGAVANK